MTWRCSRLALPAVMGLMVSVVPTTADPIPVEAGSLSLPFSGRITATFGNVESLFGQPHPVPAVPVF